MAQPTDTHTVAEHAFDHLEEEITRLEGTSRVKRWLGWGAAALLVAAVITPIVWMLATPPRSYASKSYAPTAPASIEGTSPRGVTLDEPPAHFAWESVAGRYQYLVRVYVKGSTDAILERVVTTPSLDLTPEERALMPRGQKFAWTVVAQGRDGSPLAAGEASFKLR